MPEASKTPSAKTKSRNWPVIVAGVLCVAFIVGVWVNNYRVSHAAPAVAAVHTAK